MLSHYYYNHSDSVKLDIHSYTKHNYNNSTNNLHKTFSNECICQYRFSELAKIFDEVILKT